MELLHSKESQREILKDVRSRIRKEGGNACKDVVEDARVLSSANFLSFYWIGLGMRVEKESGSCRQPFKAVRSYVY